MELPKKTMQSDKKILGIPLITFAILLSLFCGVVYYASGYASQNTKLQLQIIASKSKILSLSRLTQKLDKKNKMCNSNAQQNEDSNRELTMKVAKSEKQLSEAVDQKKQCDSQASSLHEFFLHVKDRVGVSNDATDQENTEEVSNPELDEVVEALKKLKAQHDIFKEEIDTCEKTKKTLADLHKNVQKQEEKFSELLKENNLLKDEVASVRKLQEEAEEKLSNSEVENNKRGFLQKKIATQQENVQMIDLNKQYVVNQNNHMIITNKPTNAPTAVSKESANAPTAVLKPSTKATEIKPATPSVTSKSPEGGNPIPSVTPKSTEAPKSEKKQTSESNTTEEVVKDHETEKAAEIQGENDIKPINGKPVVGGVEKPVVDGATTTEANEDDEDFEDHNEQDNN